MEQISSNYIDVKEFENKIDAKIAQKLTPLENKVSKADFELARIEKIQDCSVKFTKISEEIIKLLQLQTVTDSRIFLTGETMPQKFSFRLNDERGKKFFHCQSIDQSLDLKGKIEICGDEKIEIVLLPHFSLEKIKNFINQNFFTKAEIIENDAHYSLLLKTSKNAKILSGEEFLIDEKDVYATLNEKEMFCCDNYYVLDTIRIPFSVNENIDFEVLSNDKKIFSLFDEAVENLNVLFFLLDQEQEIKNMLLNLVDNQTLLLEEEIFVTGEKDLINLKNFFLDQSHFTIPGVLWVQKPSGNIDFKIRKADLLDKIEDNKISLQDCSFILEEEVAQNDFEFTASFREGFITRCGKVLNYLEVLKNKKRILIETRKRILQQIDKIQEREKIKKERMIYKANRANNYAQQMDALKKEIEQLTRRKND